MPAAVYVADGFLADDMVPLPRFHAQVVGTPEEVSANAMVSGEVPEAAEAVKLATGAVTTGAVTTNVLAVEVLAEKSVRLVGVKTAW